MEVIRLVLIGLLLAGCGEGLTRPAQTERAQWRHATVVGFQAAEAVPLIEAGWQARLREMGPEAPPDATWHLYIYDGTDLPFCRGPCGGKVLPERHEILLGWPRGGAYGDGRWFLRQLASHEFCHWIWWRRTGNQLGAGCTDTTDGNTWPLRSRVR